MPRFVDHAARRQELAQALWRVVRRCGVHAVSVRAVAAEAATSPGALRHYFASQDELLAFALGSVADRVTGRIIPRLAGLHGSDGARWLLEQLLPLDEDRRLETDVWLAFHGRSPGNPQLRAIREETDVRILGAVRRAVGLLDQAGAVGAGRDLDSEADRLHALVDGLAVHGSALPQHHPPAALRATLDAHLRELAAPRARSSG